MKESEAIKILQRDLQIQLENKALPDGIEAIQLAIQALETIKKLSDRKMTTEVLENYMQFEDECVKKGFTFKSVIEAREKQIPRKPITYPTTNRADCPICLNTVRGIDKPFGSYCSKCGCRLDWSDGV